MLAGYLKGAIKNQMANTTLSMTKLTTTVVGRLGSRSHRGASSPRATYFGAQSHPSSGVRLIRRRKKSGKKSSFAPRAAGSDGANGGSDGEMDTGILYERMKKIQEKEAAENSAMVDAAIEKEQAIVAGIRGDAAERPVPSGMSWEFFFFFFSQQFFSDGCPETARRARREGK